MRREGLTPGAKKLRLARAYLQGRPLFCSWQLTRRCESFCLFCEHRNEGGDAEVDLAGCRRIVSELGGLGSMVVSLTGGDPFLRSDLPEILFSLSGGHCPLVTTHGWLVTRERAREVWRAGLEGASILMDHATPVRHDERVGLPGAHARAVGALRILSEERVRDSQQVNIQARLTGDGPGAVEGLLQLAAEHGASVSLEPAFPVGRATSGRVSEALLDLKARYPHLRTGAFFLKKIDEALGEGVPGCQAGRSFLNVDHRGRVSKCMEFQGPEDVLGDLTRERMVDLAPRLQSVPRDNSCRSCWSSSRGEVEGLYTLRGLAAALPALVRA